MTRRNGTLRALVCGAVFLLAVCAVFSYLWSDLFIAEYQSDSADTLMWARASYESGRVVDPDFFYPYVIPFGGHLLMWPFVALFGPGLLAQRLGMTLNTLLLTAVMVRFFRRTVCRDLPAAFGAAGVLMMIFMTGKKLREIMFAHVIHYSLAVLFALLILSLLSDVFRKGGTRALLCLGIACFLCAAEGMAVIAFTLVPVAAAFILERLFDRRTRGETLRRDLRVVAVVAASSLAGLIAYLLLSRGMHTSYSEKYMGLAPAGSWLGALRDTLRLWGKDVLRAELYGDTAMGVQSVSRAGRSVRLAETVFMCASLPLLAVLTVTRYRKLAERIERVLVLTFWALAALTFALFVCTRAGGECWRMIPMFSMMLVCWAVMIRSMAREKGVLVKGIAYAMLFVMTAGAVYSGVGVLCADRDISAWTGEGSLINELRAHGLTRGYTDGYGLSLSVTVLTDGEIRVLGFESHADGPHPVLYQDSPRDFDGASPCFLLVGADEDEPAPGWTERFGGTTFYPGYNKEDDTWLDYAVYVYDHDPLVGPMYETHSTNTYEYSLAK